MTSSNNYILEPEDFKQIFNENIMLKKHNQLIGKIEERFSYIMNQLSLIVGYNWSWFDFDNENGEYQRGYFDSTRYKEFVYFVGEKHNEKNPEYIKYDNFFPISWLYEDFEEGLTEEVKLLEDTKNQKNKEKTVKEKIKKASIQLISQELVQVKKEVYTKIPPHLRSLFTLKTAQEIYQNRMNAQKQEDERLIQIRQELEQNKEEIKNYLTPQEYEALEFKKAEDIYKSEKSKQKHKV
jgi:hypothetical protein